LQKSNITDFLNESRTFSEESVYDYRKTVFLSHKHNDLEDEEEAKGVIEMLEDQGVKVYIDSMDNAMPEQTSGETAKRIKEIIKYCDKFILLATNKAIESFWCNWELGIGDVHKYLQNIAILPIKEKDTFNYEYKGNEYLQIYPSIDYEDGTNRYKPSLKLIPKGYYWCKPIDKDGVRYITPLKEWLTR
jgi:hypothetical protein